MSNVLIHGMEMPKQCAGCPLCEDYSIYNDIKGNLIVLVKCSITYKKMDYHAAHAGYRPDFCPLEEIKEPYREIGDLEELKAQCAVPTLKI